MRSVQSQQRQTIQNHAKGKAAVPRIENSFFLSLPPSLSFGPESTGKANFKNPIVSWLLPHGTLPAKRPKNSSSASLERERKKERKKKLSMLKKMKSALCLSLCLSPVSSIARGLLSSLFFLSVSRSCLSVFGSPVSLSLSSRSLCVCLVCVLCVCVFSGFLSSLKLSCTGYVCTFEN